MKRKEGKMWLEGKKYYFINQRRGRLEEDKFYLFIYLFIIVTWKGNLEEKTKLFWGHFLTKKLGNVFGKVYFSQV